RYQHGFWDAFFSGVSCVVSVPFYTGFLPLLFWSGHGIPVRSSRYVAALTGPLAVKKSNEVKQSGGYLQKLLVSRQESFDVDTSIRLLQYAGLAWSVVDLVPSLFSQLNL
nr:lipid phosphate phosphatase delta [Tanacetum cinerariifolium]